MHWQTYFVYNFSSSLRRNLVLSIYGCTTKMKETRGSLWGVVGTVLVRSYPAEQACPLIIFPSVHCIKQQMLSMHVVLASLSKNIKHSVCTANQITLAKHLTGATAVNWGATCNSTFIMHGDQILLVLVITICGVYVYNTHACPNDTTTHRQASGGDTQTELVASRENISTEPTSSMEMVF